MIAKVIFPLPIETAFDYRVPEQIEKCVGKWMRVKAPFRKSEAIGYVAGISKESKIRELKSLTAVLDNVPVLDNVLLRIAEYLKDNYLCSLAEAINLLLPSLLRKGRRLESVASVEYPVSRQKEKSEVFLLRDSEIKRWQFLEGKIEEAISREQGVIILEPELHLCLSAKQMIEEKFKKEVVFLHSKNTDKEELEVWLKLKNGKAGIVVGTSFAVFAPLQNLGLIIVDEEDNYVYKQEQAPFHNVKDVALFRARESRADLILASAFPSLESYYAVEKKIYKLIDSAGCMHKANVQIVDLTEERFRQRKKEIVLSSVLEHSIQAALSEKKKVMLFLSHSGFSTYALCINCGFIIKCARCSKNLVFAYAEKKLFCHACNFSISPPKTCPKCNLSYLRYLGLGTEKLESEIYRLFPFAKISRFDRSKRGVDFKKHDFDVLITAQVVLNNLKDLTDISLLGVISFDALLNRVDFRAAEKSFQVIGRLAALVLEKIVIQTNFCEHYLIKSLLSKDYNSFYREELRQRKDLSFPPFSSLALLTLRSKFQERAESAAENLFGYLRKKSGDKIELFNPIPAEPLKLRDNFRYNILLRAKARKTLVGFLKKNLRDFRRAGVIIKADIDPL